MSEPLNLVEIAPGTALRLRDGRVVIVVDNPADGMWLFCREEGGTAEEPVAASDIAGLAAPR
ncbi:hypothetical protein M0638_03425 [Roseomonas sp. NAR14]|uniref:Uncharacterized protein n=1 Tax=Roseomonas acroporae TaxID=2937791 RepID=A0A9X2BSD0_9PROT|nr:hypothetical protein [Roseomonas acroporae]MCK8783433.1 hypothetical protein [Roseomonas acroporae]